MDHGKRATYVKGCRCDECRQANTAYQSKLAKRQAHLKFNPEAAYLIDSKPVRDHIAMLRLSGMGRRQIAKLSGCSETVIMRLIGLNKDRPSNRIRPATAQKILAVQPGNLAPAGMTSSLGTRRRLQALIAIGYSQYHLADRLGTTNAHIGLLLKRQDRVLTRTAHAVTKLFTELELTPGPSSRARIYAERRGWLPPLAWDDPDTDPQPVKTSTKDKSIDHVKVELALQGIKQDLNRAETLEVVVTGKARGISYQLLDEITGSAKGTSQTRFYRYQNVAENVA